MHAEMPKRRRLKANFEIIVQRNRIFDKLASRLVELHERNRQYNQDVKRMQKATRKDYAAMSRIIERKRKGIPIDEEIKKWMHKMVESLEKRANFYKGRSGKIFKEIRSITERARIVGINDLPINPEIFSAEKGLRGNIADLKRLIRLLKKYLRTA